jgi:hypothetical protein
MPFWCHVRLLDRISRVGTPDCGLDFIVVGKVLAVEFDVAESIRTTVLMLEAYRIYTPSATTTTKEYFALTRRTSQLMRHDDCILLLHAARAVTLPKPSAEPHHMSTSLIISVVTQRADTDSIFSILTFRVILDSQSITSHQGPSRGADHPDQLKVCR